MSHKDLENALHVLSDANGPTALAEAFHALQQQVSRNRRKSKVTHGPLATTITEAIILRETLKAQGLPKAELDAAFERIVRDAWPKGRSEPWHYVCDQCNDTGLVVKECPGDETCNRRFLHAPHPFDVPCWCPKGTRFTPPPKTPDSDLDKASAKPRRFSRFGR